jgi:hypothetical protein
MQKKHLQCRQGSLIANLCEVHEAYLQQSVKASGLTHLFSQNNIKEVANRSLL